MTRLTGRRIIITGGASGIGRATARLFRQEGAAVAILDRSDNAAKAVAEEIGSVAFGCDVADPASVAAAVNQAAKAMGGLDGVVNAAGILSETGIADTTAEAFSRTVAVNLTGTFLVIQAAAPLMQAAGGGTIVNIASVDGLLPCLGTGYDSAKAAVIHFTRSLALEGRACGIACGQIDIGNAATALAAGIARGALQADGSTAPEPMMDVEHAAASVLHMASLPLSANVPFMTVMATDMPFIGRG